MDKVKVNKGTKVPVDQTKQRPGSAKKPSHSRRKRPPKRLSQRPNDVYINRSSQFAGQLSRCKRLFDQGFQEVTVHGLGAAIHRAINLSLQLRENYTLSTHTTTSTVQLVDDLEPLTDDVDYQTQSRPSSAIHIRLSRLSPPPTPSSLPTSSSHPTPPSLPTPSSHPTPPSHPPSSLPTSSSLPTPSSHPTPSSQTAQPSQSSTKQSGRRKSSGSKNSGGKSSDRSSKSKDYTARTL